MRARVMMNGLTDVASQCFEEPREPLLVLQKSAILLMFSKSVAEPYIEVLDFEVIHEDRFLIMDAE